MTPRLLDLYCGAGGASAGYARAGFEVVGIDRNPQPRYPFEFRQGDVVELMRLGALDLAEFDAVHASPPCQLFSSATPRGARVRHVDAVAATREYLIAHAAGRPWVIENVPGAPLRQPLQLCGSEFALHCTIDDVVWHLRRHRLFEANVILLGAGGCYCRTYRNRIIAVGGHGPHARDSLLTHGRLASAKQAATLLGIDWMNRRELSQAIPPAYTEHVGAQLAALIEARRA
jgi:DNA (cytosine-5)-methyltransferase 1